MGCRRPSAGRRVTIVRTRACSAALAVLLSAPPSVACAAPARDCTLEAQLLSNAQSELPRLDATSPQDRPPYCITIETIMTFANRVKAHVAHCPNSDFAAAMADWTKTQTDYSKLFTQHRCKRTL
jgi:hypothetical protein